MAAGLTVRVASLVASVIAGGAIACGHEATATAVVVFSGDFTLVQADDWIAKQACNYVMPVDQTVCSWGRLTVRVDQVAVSVRGSDVHAGLASGPVIHRDSVTYTAPLRVVDACAITIDSTGVTPNGRGVLAGDSLHFDGHGSLGDSLSWGYLVINIVLASPCP